MALMGLGVSRFGKFPLGRGTPQVSLQAQITKLGGSDMYTSAGSTRETQLPKPSNESGQRTEGNRTSDFSSNSIPQPQAATRSQHGRRRLERNRCLALS